ncbi:SDR family oxidoreductase [Mucilaginibacter agri]|uniref:SDR family NAD(P)-dependent oxidoreductase n=1 Tax=Mucilaginibacter agri TaxID=2695265 RepID=A0A965ZIF1_9SPHI|nr:SDR family oxidoreductase [Mucilaginibacter agri]NCD70677.1 SDR family NAD(P)-dependent oxidoreductase [Mucilaginibacter agri]
MKQSILITGASAGIGKASAIYFANKGWNVAATMRNTGNQPELEQHNNIKLYQLDVTDAESVTAAAQAVVDDFGQIDVLLNNAGYGLVGPLESATEADVMKQFDTNLFGVIRVIKAVVPTMKAQKNGIIINVTSIGGLVAFPFNSLYHATKFGLDGLSESLKYEFKPFGIKVKVVAPGGVITDFAGRSLHTTIKPGEKSDYDEALAKVWARFDANKENYSTAELMAEIIYGAATDGSDQLRYVAGKDAEGVYAAWKSMDNEAFFDMVSKNFGLEE